MVQELTQLGSVAGRLGKGFGQGLAEQLPKGIQRGALSEGLRQLGPQGEDLAKLSMIPGLAENPQLFDLALKNLRTQNYRKKELPETKAKTVAAPGQVEQPSAIVPTSEVPSITQPSTSPLATKKQITEFKKMLLEEPSPTRTKELADQYIDEGLASSPEEAKAMATQQLTQEREAQRNNLKDFEDTTSKRLGLTFQGEGLGDYKDLSGEIQKRLLDEGAHRILAQGKNPQEVAQEIDDIGSMLGKTATLLKRSVDQIGNSAGKARDIRKYRKEFEKYGFENIYDDLVQGETELTPVEIGNIVRPLKNDVITKAIDKLSTSHITGRKTDEKVLEHIARSIRPEDNIQSVFYELREKRRNIDQLKGVIEQLADEHEIGLTDQQKIELDKPINNSFYGDLLFRAFK